MSLSLAILAIYGRVVSFGFTNFDDPGYVTHCAHVRSGPSWRGLAWAFTSMHAGCWHPLTSISLMFDAAIAGPDPRVYHLVNLLLHAGNAILLFTVLRVMTGRRWPSAFVALLFAVHPLHVESVAWVSSRKDVLSMMFWLLTTLAYVRYARGPTTGRYLGVIVLFALGLMAKPMLVSLPIVLLLLDYWPLGRLKMGGAAALLLEKAPLLVLAALSSIITFIVWRRAGAVQILEHFPLGVRVANALVAYVTYLAKTFWPTRLAVFYPHPRDTLPAWEVLAAAAVLSLVTVLCVWVRRSRPYCLVGWVWFLVTLFPVIGLVQVGMQAMADRWTYIPLVGIFIMVVWAVPDLLGSRLGAVRQPQSALPPSVRVAMTGAAVAAGLLLMASTWVQVGYWRDSVVLFEHALSVTSHNAWAHKYLGMALESRARKEEAIEQYAEAVRIDPDYVGGRAYLARALVQQGRLDEALPHFVEAVRIEPGLAPLRVELAEVLLRKGRIKEALERYRQAVGIDPSSAEARVGLGIALDRMGRVEEAVVQFKEALHIDPRNESARIQLERMPHR